jgi:hypothetical protein
LSFEPIGYQAREHSPLRNAHAFLGQDFDDAQAFHLRPNQNFLHAASEPVTSTVSVNCARSTRATVTHAASPCSVDAWGARWGEGCMMSASATPTAANTTMQPTISFLSINPSR